LEDNQFAGKGKVAINGSSNGGKSQAYSLVPSPNIGINFALIIGLLVAACVNRAPEGTFGAAVGDVGVYDYLKVSSMSYVFGYVY
jgi:prolyl oligopeptidase